MYEGLKEITCFSIHLFVVVKIEVGWHCLNLGTIILSGMVLRSDNLWRVKIWRYRELNLEFIKAIGAVSYIVTFLVDLCFSNSISFLDLQGSL